MRQHVGCQDGDRNGSRRSLPNCTATRMPLVLGVLGLVCMCADRSVIKKWNKMAASGIQTPQVIASDDLKSKLDGEEMAESKARMLNNSTVGYQSYSSLESSLTDQAMTVGGACKSVIGKRGRWVQDWDFAKNYGQHILPLVYTPGPHVRRTHGRWKNASNAPYPWRTSWRWEDESGCHMDVNITALRFCDMLERLKLQQVYMLGDSLMQSQYSSLVNKLGGSHVRRSNKGFNAELICPHTNVAMVHTRIYRGIGAPDSMVMPEFIREGLQNASRNSLVVVNLGAHYHNTTEYHEDSDIFLEWLKELYKPGDSYWFRTTAPGHGNCQPRNPKKYNFASGGPFEVPLDPPPKNASVAVSSQYSWDSMAIYNQYTEKTWMTHDNSVIKGMVDIYPMTVLRRDGHTGGADCLHYVEPGPVDWWNFLWFTLLQYEVSEMSSDAAKSGIINQ